MTQVQDKSLGVFVIDEPTLTSFPNIHEPRAVKRNGKDTGKKKYSLSYEFTPDSKVLAALKSKMVQVAKAANPNIDVKTLRLPITSGDKLAEKAEANGKKREWSKGKVVLTARSEFQPGVSHVVGGSLIDVDGENAAQIKKSFYTGVLALGEINLVYYAPIEDGDRPGITAYINKVCSLNKGERLTGGRSAAETFKGYIGTSTDEDPTLGDDDEIEF